MFVNLNVDMLYTTSDNGTTKRKKTTTSFTTIDWLFTFKQNYNEIANKGQNQRQHYI